MGMMKSVVFLAALPVISVAFHWLPFDQSLPCLINPLAEVAAGNILEFHLSNSRNSTCEATLNFADNLFLPVTITISPQNCAGDQLASIDIPCNSPTGLVAIQWQCIGSSATSCAILNITGGTGDYEKFQKELIDAEPPNIRCINSSSVIKTLGNLSPSPTAILPSIDVCM